MKFFTVIERTGVYPLIVAEGVHAPIALLFDALMSLDDGKVSLMLAPKKRSGRAHASSFYNGLKGIAVFTVQRLQATGVKLDGWLQPFWQSRVFGLLAKVPPMEPASSAGARCANGKTILVSTWKQRQRIGKQKQLI